MSLEYTAGPSSWGRALRARPLRSCYRSEGRAPPVVGAAGARGHWLCRFLLATAATTANGTDLRNDRRPELTNLIAERKS